MLIWMMLIFFVFFCFLRVVCDFFVKLGKQVELKIFGEVMEFDKVLIECIVDFLIYLICNSLDYGIELLEQCIVVGKRLFGMIMLKVFYQGGNVVIEVGDDGVGLLCYRIFVKVWECGFMVFDQMMDVEVFNLIFEVGFLIVEQVIDVLGCGVGMDVV